MSAELVLSGEAKTHVECADLLAYLPTLPEQSIDLVFGSPPYEDARTYGIDFALKGQAWVDWMVQVVKAGLRVSRGLVAFVVGHGKTEDFSWSAAPALLLADLKRAGVCLRAPKFFRRDGIPGSGGPDDLKQTIEYIVCATNGGRLPWSDNKACGHPPLWGPGGEMSYRQSDGKRVNQWGGSSAPGNGQRRKSGERQPKGRLSHVVAEPEDLRDEARLFEEDEPEQENAGGKRNECGISDTTTRRRQGSGKRETQRLGRGQGAGPKGSTSYQLQARGHAPAGAANGDLKSEKNYRPPAMANPGNVLQQTYTAEEVAAILAAYGILSDVADCKSGGGHMGNKIASENEAPFPERLPELYVKTFCPIGGIVLDPFAGSGTTLAVAVKWQRRAIGCDIRQSQVDLARRRLGVEQPELFV